MKQWKAKEPNSFVVSRGVKIQPTLEGRADGTRNRISRNGQELARLDASWKWETKQAGDPL